MQDQRYYFKISPENIIGDLVSFPYTGQTDISVLIDPCCPITSTTINQITGTTGVYLPMSVVLSGGTNGESLLSCLTVPLLFTENIIGSAKYAIPLPEYVDILEVNSAVV